MMTSSDHWRCKAVSEEGARCALDANHVTEAKRRMHRATFVRGPAPSQLEPPLVDVLTWF